MKYTLKKTGTMSSDYVHDLQCLDDVRYDPSVGDLITILDEDSQKLHVLLACAAKTCEDCPVADKESYDCIYSVEDIRRGGLALCRHKVGLIEVETLLEDL